MGVSETLWFGETAPTTGPDLSGFWDELPIGVYWYVNCVEKRVKGRLESIAGFANELI